MKEFTRMHALCEKREAENRKLQVENRKLQVRGYLHLVCFGLIRVLYKW